MRSRSVIYTELPSQQIYSEILDVRSPSEFAEDHIPGAINLPVLDDPQRSEVGTLYKQVDPFAARKLGAALVCQNIATHLSHHFSSKDKNYRPLIYCWRGGQRSQSMATVLAEIGWPVTVIQGGYKTYRAYVRDQLDKLPQQFTYCVLCGPTGSGKTHILRQLQQRGASVLDLESLANHRGSVLGEEWNQGPETQPSQKYFESLIAQTLQRFTPGIPVWVESESNKIGKLYLPAALWQEMKQASVVAIEVSVSDRIRWLLEDYPHFISNPHILKGKLQRLKSLYSREQLKQWEQFIEARDWETLVRELLERHYDPTYRRSLQCLYPNLKQTLTLPDLSHSSINALIDSLLTCSK